jgi:putative hydrolase of the HAD superfamily
MARNLPPAAAMGMTTAWVRTASDWARQGAAPEHIHHVIDELGPWLTAATRKPE